LNFSKISNDLISKRIPWFWRQSWSWHKNMDILIWCWN